MSSHISQTELLLDALLSAFPKHSDLRQMVRFQLGENLEAIADGENQTDRLFNLITWAESRGHLSELITSAANANPKNEKLRRWIETYASNPSPSHTLIQSTNHAATVTDPFTDQGPITDPLRFFDHEEKLKEIIDNIRIGRNTSVIGEAQVGKSSLLKLIECLGPEYTKRPSSDFRYLNMELLDSNDEFFFALSNLFGLPEPMEGFRLKLALGERRIVLCLDELENMRYEGFTSQVRSNLRGLANGNDSPLTLVAATRTSLIELFPDSDNISPMHNVFYEVKLNSFPPRVVSKFLQERLSGTNMKFDKEEEDFLIRESGGNPGELQRLASQLYKRKTERH